MKQWGVSSADQGGGKQRLVIGSCRYLKALPCWPRAAAGIIGWEGEAVRAFLPVVATAIMLCGCGSNRGILPAGPDTYTLTERYAAIRGGGDEAEQDALLKAHDFCTTMGRKFVPSNMGQGTVTFKCLLPDDPAVAAYQLQQAPNVIIEQRNPAASHQSLRRSAPVADCTSFACRFQ